MIMHMSATTTRRANFTVAALLGLAAATASVGARAFEITAEQREACMGDVMHLCSDEIPDVNRVLACMRVHKSEVSARCRATIPKAVAAAL